MVSHNLAVVGHLCESLAVMQNGEIVEMLSVDELRAHKASQLYTQELLASSTGFVRSH